jgi:hypothetical protein
MKNFTRVNLAGINKGFFSLFFFLMMSLGAFAQNVGINATGTNPNTNAGLDIDFPDKGLLIPRVALSSSSSASPLAAHVAGMVVYNTATAGDVVPGFYYDNGTKWIKGFIRGNAAGDMLYWSGSEWVMIPIGIPGQYLQISGSSLPYWGVGGLSALTTTAASSITSSSASSGGNITSAGGSSIIERGICYGTSPAPTIANSKITSALGTGTGSYAANITGLSIATTYYVRAYAINTTSVSYGNEISFTTLGVAPTLAATTAATIITTTSATSGGNVTATGGAPITERGICYSTSANPTISNTKVIDGSPGLGSFTSNLSGLSVGTTYYVRAYATNSSGLGITGYGAQISFSTRPSVTATATATAIAATTATTGGTIAPYVTSSLVTAYGVAYSTSSNAASPTLVQTGTSANITTAGLTYVTSLTGLTSNTLYYIRAYASGTGFTVYGPELSFTTSAPTTPVIASTTAAYQITTTSALSGGTITNDGGSAITAKGVCWGLTPNPVIGAGNYTSNGTGPASYSSSITGLTRNTLYYVRAYATNAIGTSYSSTDITFTTINSLYSLGQFLNYGWAAYIAADGSGFIVSPDISPTSPATTFTWGCNGTHVAVGTAIGTGKTNTDLIISSCGATTAAGVAKAYTGGGFNDWYLPSSSEFQQVATNYTLFGFSGGYTSYFTSSEYGTNYANATSFFYTGSQAYSSGSARIGDTYTTRIRAIRNFAAPALTAPTVYATTAVSSITATGGASGGQISSDGGAAVTARGVCWNTGGSPTITDSKTTNGTGTGSFTSSITGLSTGIPCYVRAYATNSVGTSYGPEVSFTPVAPGWPLVTTTAASSVGLTAASSGGNVTSDGGYTVTARGVCWGPSSNPVLGVTNFTTDGTGTGTFTSTISGLTEGTLYNVRAYATNTNGTSYGGNTSFTTLTLPTVTTDVTTNIVGTTATSGGNVTSAGSSAVTARGVCYSTVTGPTTADNIVADVPGTGTGTFVSALTGLTTGTPYFVRAYATSAAGTAYGNEETFTPTGPGIPTLTTAPVTSPTQTGGTSGGDITSDGGAAVTARGVCWNVAGAPTISDSHTSDGTGTGTFVSTLSGMVIGNWYTIRAYATNSAGTAYGQEEYYMPAGPPSVTTIPLSFTVPTTTVSSGFNISSDNGDMLTAGGIVWGTSSGATVASHLGIYSVDPNAPGNSWYMTTDMTGLDQSGSTTYYVRAYATNGIGTTYGNEISFNPGISGLPVVSTTAILNLIGSLAEGGGDVVSDGGDMITSAGLCWDVTADPTILANLGSTGDGAYGQFYSLMSGLTVGTTYHVRAYATNTNGTAYGNDLSFVATAATVGQVIQGGWNYGNVIQVDGTGNHGIIAYSNEYLDTDWGCANSSVSTGTASGTGDANTTAILNNIAANSCVTSNTSNAVYAPEACKWIGPDWYLPSKDELNSMWTNRVANGLDNAFSFATYPIWSSSQVDATHAWTFDGTNWVNTSLKTEYNWVWPIRNF